MDSLLAPLKNVRITLIGIFAAALIYWLWTRRDVYKYFLNSRVEWGLPFLGVLGIHMRSVNDVLPCMKRLLEKGDYMISTWLGLNPVLIVAEPKILEKIFTSPDLLNKSASIYDSLNYGLGAGLVTSKSDEWKIHRKLINPAFNHKTLLSFFSIFEQVKCDAIATFNSLDDGQEHSIIVPLQDATFNASVATTMGTSYDALEYKNTKNYLSQTFIYALETTTNRAIVDLLKLGWIFNLNPKYRMKLRHLRRLVKNMFDSRLIAINEESTKCEKLRNDSLDECESIRKDPKIFVDHAIQIIQKTDIKYQSIITEANHIVASSFETTANTIYSFITLLAMHPDVQERLFEEISLFYPDKDFHMEYAHIQQLPYLDMVINEVLRLAPALPVIGRRVVKDTQLTEDILLPRNLDVLIPIVLLHRRKDIWGPDADKFNPDNFLPENIKGKHPYAFIPFSKGNRNCIGWRYALFFINIVGSGLVRNFKFSTNFKFEDLVVVENITLKYEKYPEIRIERR